MTEKLNISRPSLKVTIQHWSQHKWDHLEISAFGKTDVHKHLMLNVNVIFENLFFLLAVTSSIVYAHAYL